MKWIKNKIWDIQIWWYVKKLPNLMTTEEVIKAHQDIAKMGKKLGLWPNK